MEAVKTKKSDEAVPREVLRAERSLRQLIGLQEILTIMMVIAALSSAVATCKATQIIARGERPIIGVDSIWLTEDTAKRPYVAVNYRNFGTEPAGESVLDGWAAIDGKVASFDPLKPHHRKVHLKLGVLSPLATHLFAAYFKPDALRAIREGRAELKVMIRIVYQSLRGEPYYQMDFRRHVRPGGRLRQLPQRSQAGQGSGGLIPSAGGFFIDVIAR
jgi:hypothetical protein